MTFYNYLRLLKWKIKGSNLPIPHCRKQQMIQSIKKQTGYTVFVETGTFMGDMIEAQKSNFSKLFSIELSDELYIKAKKRFEKNTNITILKGDSSVMLNDIIDTLSAPAVFWLDGHYSGDGTAKGKLECPVFEELDAILQKKELKHVILIDDARLFIGKNDYPTINEIQDYFRKKDVNINLTIKDDAIKIELV